MAKKKMLSALLISALTLTALAACGEAKQTAKENVEVSTDTEDIVQVTETQEAPSKEVTEYTDSYCFTEVDGTRENVDEIELDDETEPNNWVTLKDTINFYNSNGFYLGYTKPNIEVNILGKTDNWVCFELADTSIVFSKASEFYAVVEVVENSENTESVENSEISEPEVVESETTDNSAKENTNTNKETQNTEPAYTVKDMSATKYAKQSVNVRKGPGTSYGKVGSLSTNQKVTVTGQADNGWYRIDYNGTEAFVSNNYLVDKKVETTNNDTSNKKDTSSSNNSSKNNSTSNNSTNENENNSGNTNKNTENNNNSNTGGTTSKTYTEAEVISIFRNTLESNGIQWYPSVFPNSEAGPSGGMGYGSASISMIDPYTEAAEEVEAFRFEGWNLYYLDGVSSSNGKVYFTLYSGTM